MHKFLLPAVSFFTTICIHSFAFAEDVSLTNEHDVQLFKAIAAGLTIAIAAVGGAIGQGMAASAALNGIARNPNAADKIQTPLLLSLALIESLVIYALLVSAGWVGPLGS